MTTSKCELISTNDLFLLESREPCVLRNSSFSKAQTIDFSYHTVSPVQEINPNYIILKSSPVERRESVERREYLLQQLYLTNATYILYDTHVWERFDKGFSRVKTRGYCPGTGESAPCNQMIKVSDPCHQSLVSLNSPRPVAILIFFFFFK